MRAGRGHSFPRFATAVTESANMICRVTSRLTCAPSIPKLRALSSTN
jgi:hypothetical protein